MHPASGCGAGLQPASETGRLRTYPTGKPRLIDGAGQPAGQELMEVIPARLALHTKPAGGEGATSEAALHLFADADIFELDLVRHAHADLSSRVWELRHNLTAYDATYLALAEALDATLVTGDRGFTRVPDRRAPVEVWR